MKKIFNYSITFIIGGTIGYFNIHFDKYKKYNNYIDFDISSNFNMSENFNFWELYKKILIGKFIKNEKKDSFIFNTTAKAQGHFNINHGGFTAFLNDISVKESLYNFIKENDYYNYDQLKTNKMKLQETYFFMKYLKPINTNKDYNIIIKNIIFNNDKKEYNIDSEIWNNNKIYCISKSYYKLINK